MRSRVQVARFPILCSLVACSPQQPAEEPAANAVEASSAATGGSSGGWTKPASEPAAEPDPEPEAEPPAPVASEPGLRALCERVCAKVKDKCSASVAERCAVNCDQYDRTAPACEGVARAALDCASEAPDLPCANLAPASCTRAFQRMATCQRAPDAFADEVSEKKGGPTGWVRFEPGGEGFSVPMPPGVEKDENLGEKAWSVRAGEVTYFVRKLPPPAEKLTAKSQVRLVMGWLAPCNLGLKLHGQVDDGDSTSVHYDIGCKSGTERHGILRITKNALFITGVEGPPGERGEFGAFVYGFEAR